MAKTDVAPRAKVNLPANLMQQLAAEVAEIQNRIGSPTGNRIRVTQSKKFRMPSGEESAGPITGVIVDFITAYYYYTGQFDPNDIQPPECFALGEKIIELAPHATAPNKQAESCAICPQNQFGSAGRGKACSNTRLLALLPPDATEETPIMILRVSPTALRSYDAYVAGVARSFQSTPIGVVTEFSFDPSSEYASLRFAPQGMLNEAQLRLFLSRRDEARKILMTPPDIAPPMEMVKPKASRKGR